MKIFQDKTYKSADLELTPLINIVFLILIFFLMAGSLKPAEVIDPVRTRSVDKPASPESMRTITLLRDGSLLFEDAVIDRQALTSHLNAVLEDERLLAVKPDAGLPAGELVGLLQLLRHAGHSSVHLLSITDPGER